MFLGCNLSAMLPRSTFTKYHLLCSQYCCDIKPVSGCGSPWWTILMIILLLFLQKQSLAFDVYLFGIGTLLTGLGLKKNTCDNALTMTSPVPWWLPYSLGELGGVLSLLPVNPSQCSLVQVINTNVTNTWHFSLDPTATTTTRPLWTLDFGLWSSYFTVTWSSTGPIKRFREMTAAHVGGHGWGFPGSLLSWTLSSYGASAVARTSDRGHVSSIFCPV